MFAAPLAKARMPRSGTVGRAKRVKDRGHQSARPREGTASWSFGAVAVLQPKLAVGAANDPLEHEADRVAEQVMRMPASGTLASDAPPRISRKCASCEEEKARTKPAGPDRRGDQEAPGIVHEVLQAPGRPLDTASRAFFEPRFGHDFSRVRVHADPRAAASAGAIGAHAYAMGPNIVFAAGQYAPSSQRGQHLLAHELAHVVQQGHGGPAVQRAVDGNGGDGGAEPTSADAGVPQTDAGPGKGDCHKLNVFSGKGCEPASQIGSCAMGQCCPAPQNHFVRAVGRTISSFKGSCSGDPLEQRTIPEGDDVNCAWFYKDGGSEFLFSAMIAGCPIPIS